MTFFSCPPEPEGNDYDPRLWDQLASDLDEMGFTFTPTREQSMTAHPSNGGGAS